MGILLLAGAGVLAFLGSVFACLSRNYRHQGIAALITGSIGAAIGVAIAFVLGNMIGTSNASDSVTEQWAVVFGLSWFGLGAGASIMIPIMWKGWVQHRSK